MTKMYAVCKRCHRLRPLKEAGYCEACRATLRAAERPKQRLSEIEAQRGAPDSTGPSDANAHTGFAAGPFLAPQLEEAVTPPVGALTLTFDRGVSEEHTIPTTTTTPGAHDEWAGELAESLVMAGENPKLGALEFEEGEPAEPPPIYTTDKVAADSGSGPAEKPDK